MRYQCNVQLAGKRLHWHTDASCSDDPARHNVHASAHMCQNTFPVAAQTQPNMLQHTDRSWQRAPYAQEGHTHAPVGSLSPVGHGRPALRPRGLVSSHTTQPPTRGRTRPQGPATTYCQPAQLDSHPAHFSATAESPVNLQKAPSKQQLTNGCSTPEPGSFACLLCSRTCLLLQTLDRNLRPDLLQPQHMAAGTCPRGLFTARERCPTPHRWLMQHECQVSQGATD